ncbi:MAG TPA: hypothetical protein VGE98_01595 [Thermoanaerobaculia bacterium]
MAATEQSGAAAKHLGAATKQLGPATEPFGATTQPFAAATQQLGTAPRKLGAAAKQFGDVPTLSRAATPPNSFAPNPHDEATSPFRIGNAVCNLSTKMDDGGAPHRIGEA